MKNTKIEFWRKVKENAKCHLAGCAGFICDDSCKLVYASETCGICKSNNRAHEALVLAEAYIKRHEQKSKKKNHIRDAKKKVDSDIEKLKKDYVKNLKSVEEPTPLEIAKMIRDNKYKFDCKYNETGCGDCKASGFCDTGGFCQKNVIDDYISANEPTVKENLSVPQPIKFEDPVPENVYAPAEDCIRFYNVIEYVLKKRKRLESSTDEFLIYLRNPRTNDTLWIDARECYRTPEEALQVAKKIWEVEE